MKCLNCENSGVCYIPDYTGDDFEIAYCYCPEGKRAEANSVMQKLPVTFIKSNGAPVITRK